MSKNIRFVVTNLERVRTEKITYANPETHTFSQITSDFKEFYVSKDGIPSDKVFSLLFPNSKLGKAESAAGLKVTRIALLKVSQDKKISRSQGLLPPEGINEKSWFCVFGRCCRFCKESFGTVDLDIAIRLCRVLKRVLNYCHEIDPVYYESVIDKEFSSFGTEKTYSERALREEKQVKRVRSRFSTTPTQPLALFQITKAQDINKLRAYLPHLAEENLEGPFFACYHHFGQISVKNPEVEVQSDLDKANIIFKSHLRGELSFESLFVGKREDRQLRKGLDQLLPYHRSLCQDHSKRMFTNRKSR